MKALHKDTGEIIQLAEEGVISSDGRRFCWYQVELLPEPIDEVQPSLPDNLDEAAREIVIKMHPCMEDCAILGDRLTRGQLMALVKAGAEWMAEQMNLPRWNTDSDPNFKPGKYFCVANALISPQGWSIAFKDLEKLPGFKED